MMNYSGLYSMSHSSRIGIFPQIFPDKIEKQVNTVRITVFALEGIRRTGGMKTELINFFEVRLWAVKKPEQFIMISGI
jgi:hypothetical protein